MNQPVSASHPLKHYIWGQGCDGWNLVDTAELSVKKERILPHTGEQLHYHERARQFFFILKGRATFEFPYGRQEVCEQEGLEIPPGQHHRILNETGEDLEIILCSQPSTTGDRINL